ncbi:IclR family transcriptional regulator [Microbacterium sp. dk485]|uniref:IclR family transcriptional regulator n=1 Tax=Microbacterium TaxID=33882 RepID=UPI0010731742|nr:MULTISPECIES: IclR family transcriptional regulator [Microbacterium]TFV84891.1 IclR family transcriptional regulator [Microbacterium sp. dk485]TXK11687.1 IclR family transcriptional regulator [Microbacterium wangchenii]
MGIDEDASAPRHPVGAVDQTLQLLLLLRTHSELRVTDVARELGVSPSTAHRHLSTLEYRGFVTQDRITRAYRTGPALIELGFASTRSIDLRSVSEPHLRDLSIALGETVNLMVLQESSVRFIAGFEADQRTRTHVLTGTLLPAYATSGGKVLLAELSREALRALYPRGLRRFTPHTRTFTQLLDELALVSMRGYAVNDQESVEGLRALAVPLRDRGGTTIAAVAMSAPSARLTSRRTREVVVHLRGCAAGIRAHLAR